MVLVKTTWVCHGSGLRVLPSGMLKKWLWFAAARVLKEPRASTGVPVPRPCDCHTRQLTAVPTGKLMYPTRIVVQSWKSVSKINGGGPSVVVEVVGSIVVDVDDDGVDVDDDG